MAGRGHFAVHNPGRCRFRRGEMMTNAMVTLGIAVGGTSLICYALITRLHNRRANRGSSADSSGGGSGNDSGEHGWSISNWFGGDNPWIVRAIRATRAVAIAAEAAMGVEAAMEVAEVINAAGPAEKAATV